MTKNPDMKAQVSVVIPCYNAERWVARTIASVQDQGDVVAQIIVVDDGSTDGSLEVLRPFEARGEITLITGPNSGGSHARNRGLTEVAAPFVMFLDADDEIEGGILKGSVEAARARDADIVFSKMEIRYPDGRSLLQGPVGPPIENEREVFANWFDGDWIGCCSVVWHCAFLRGIGGWNETVRVGDDGDVVLRALLNDAKATRNDEGKGIYYRGNPGSVSLSGGETEAKLAQHVDQIIGFCEAARIKGWDDDLGRNYAALYFLARKAFMGGYTDLGRRALGVIRAAGHRRHHGTQAHMLLASLIGLERKVRFFGS